MQAGRQTLRRLIIFGVPVGLRPSNFGRFGQIFWRIIRPDRQVVSRDRR